MKNEIDVVTIEQGGITERFVSAVALPGEKPADFFGRMAGRTGNAHCAALDVFGGSPDETARAALHAVFPRESIPVTWVCEEDAGPGTVRAAQAWVVDGAPVKTLTRGGVALGCTLEDAHVRYARLGGLLPGADGARDVQTREVLDSMLSLLHEAGMDFGHVTRTWFYNANILDWYADFNAARDRFFREHDVFSGLVPASTGMAGGNPPGRALTAGALAVSPKSAGVAVRRVDSPLQGSARDYGSSFSRAVEVATPSARRLLISGTASIAPDGHTLHTGDLKAQIRLTFKVVGAILESRGMGWEHVTRAIAYFKPGAVTGDRGAFHHLFPRIPIVPVTNHVCRDDLLFETELEAVCVEPVSVE